VSNVNSVSTFKLVFDIELHVVNKVASNNFYTLLSFPCCDFYSQCWYSDANG